VHRRGAGAGALREVSRVSRSAPPTRRMVLISRIFEGRPATFPSQSVCDCTLLADVSDLNSTVPRMMITRRFHLTISVANKNTLRG
jgi:hypothetical protein